MSASVLRPPLNIDNPEPITFKTHHGSGRTDVFYDSPKEFMHRPINNHHQSTRGGDLYLNYQKAEYSGPIVLKSRSHTAFGMQGSFPSPKGGEKPGLPWVGEKDGVDRMTVYTPSGWVGLYFQ